MKLLKQYTKAILIVYLLISLSINTFSIYYDNEDIEIRIYSETEAKEYYELMDISVIFSDIPINEINNSIISFAVSDKGYIAIGLDNSKILVLDENETPVSLIDFNLQHTDHFGLDFNGDNICIFFISIMMEIDIHGELVCVSEAKMTPKSSVYFQSTQGRNRKSISIDSTTYSLENDVGVLEYISGGRFSKLVKYESHDKKAVLYDTSDTMYPQVMIYIIFAFVIVSTVAFSLIYIVKKKDRGNTRRNTGDGSMFCGTKNP